MFKGGVLSLWILLTLAPAAVAAGSRVALVVGAAAYQHIPALANTLSDARGMASKLQELGYDVDLVTDPDRAQFEGALRRLGQRAVGADSAVVYYAGHGLEFKGHNYLVPVQATINGETDIPFELIDLDLVLTQIEGQARVSVVILDACRNNPFRLLRDNSRDTASDGGLAVQNAPVGTLIAFSTQPGAVAMDNSPFTESLIRNIGTPGMEVRQMLTRVRKDVDILSHGQQIPWDASNLEGDFYFAGASNTERLNSPAEPAKLLRQAAEQNNAAAAYALAQLYAAGDGVPKDADESYKWLKFAAEAGLPEAQSRLGDNIKDANEAFNWHRRSAEQGEVHGQVMLGRDYDLGLGVARDSEQALKWFTLAAQQGEPAAQEEVGMHYMYGWGTKTNPREAIGWLEQAVAKGRGPAKVKIGLLYMYGVDFKKDYTQALNYFRLAASENVPEAFFHLGQMYEQGLGIHRNNTLAYMWYDLANAVHIEDISGDLRRLEAGMTQEQIGRAKELENICRQSGFINCYADASVMVEQADLVKAAQQGNTDAQADLGQKYVERFLDGKIPADEIPDAAAAAFQWLLLAANKGNAGAQNALGIMYSESMGVERDWSESHRYFALAAAQGFDRAQYNLGISYQLGEGVIKDAGQAAHWYLLAAQQNYARAQVLLGILYMTGEGVQKNSAEALKWFQRAADLKERDGQWMVGQMYELAEGVPRDYKKAMEWYKLAAAQESPEAQAKIGALYYQGWGVPKNYAEALTWFRRGAAHGDAGANEMIGLMYERGVGGLSRDYVLAYLHYDLANSGFNRTRMEMRVTAQQLAKAKQLTVICRQTHYRDCP